jgi:ferritin-like metal-binding protein YciE
VGRGIAKTAAESQSPALKAAGSADLKKTVEAHLEEMKKQITILKDVFKAIGEKPEGEKCDAIEGLIKETDGIIKRHRVSSLTHA